MSEYIELIYYFAAFAPGVTVNIYLISMLIKYKNAFIGYFTGAYLGTSVLVVCYLANNILGLAGLAHLYEFIGIGEAACMSCIIWSLSTLILKIFYGGVKQISKISVAAISAIPVLLYAVKYLGLQEAKIFNSAYYLFFILALIAECILFLAQYRRINHTQFRKLGVIIACALSFFIVLFALQAFVPKFEFDSFPLFYLFFTAQLISFSWKHFVSGAVGDVLNVKESFIEKYAITNREREIVELIGQGCSNSDIAKKLYVSEKTAANHIYNIYKKLGISSRFELICMYKK